MLDCFGMNVDFSYFKWKFLDNPSGEVIGYMAVDRGSGEVAGYYGAIPELYSIRGEERIIYQSCDTMTHSKHRRKGLFKALSAKCFEQLDEEGSLFLIGFSGPMSTPGFLKFGWKKVAEMQMIFIPNWPGALSKDAHPDIREIKNVNEIRHLIQKSNTPSEIFSIRNTEIFSWRIANPRNQYKLSGIQRDGRVASYCCHYRLTNKLLLFDHYFETRSDGRALIRELRRIVKQNGLKGIMSYVQLDSDRHKQLSRVGFIRNPFGRGPLNERTPFIIYSSDQVMDKNDVGDYWELSAFDHDAL